MVILICGGAGFIGAQLVELLLQRGESVVSFDLYPDPGRIGHLGNKLKVVTGDITRIEDLIAAIRDFRVQRIVNLAYILGAESEANLQLAVRVNVMGMNNVFEAARLMGIKRVVYASSIAVYGLQSHFGERPVTEEDTCRPTLVYGAHKLCNEFMAQKYMDQFGMTIPGLRIAIVSGPGRKTGLTGWGSTYIDNPVLGKPAQIPLRSGQRTLVVYVEDVAEIFARLCLDDKIRYPIYNSCAYAITLAELAQAVRKFIPGAKILFDEQATEQPLVYSCSSRRLEEEFGIRMPPLEEMVKKHINAVRKKAGLLNVQV